MESILYAQLNSQPGPSNLLETYWPSQALASVNPEDDRKVAQLCCRCNDDENSHSTAHGSFRCFVATCLVRWPLTVTLAPAVALPASLHTLALDPGEFALYAGGGDGRIFEVPLTGGGAAEASDPSAGVKSSPSTVACHSARRDPGRPNHLRRKSNLRGLPTFDCAQSYLEIDVKAILWPKERDEP
eukprot:scaffold249807_cov31-Prasinocladus_malaysianus.AAC.1